MLGLSCMAQDRSDSGTPGMHRSALGMLLGLSVGWSTGRAGLDRPHGPPQMFSSVGRVATSGSGILQQGCVAGGSGASHGQFTGCIGYKLCWRLYLFMRVLWDF
jgi:hypothetical protein